MNKTRVFLLLTTLVIILASSMTALAQTPTVSIGSPTGGSIVDTEVRVAVESILGALRAHGLIAT